MSEQIYKCECGRYTLERICPDCNQKTVRSDPPKYKLSDKYAKLRQKLMHNEK